MLPSTIDLASIVDRALGEDLSAGDPTTSALIPPHLEATASIVSRAPGVLAGLDVAFAVFRRVEPSISCAAKLLDGDRLEDGSVIAVVNGRLTGMLAAERTALNFLQRMSGIATMTAAYVEAVHGTGAAIIDTRKTAPGLRMLDKYAVTRGGGKNHRQNLGDGILIKDNHLAALRAQGLSMPQIIRQARNRGSHTLRVQVEVECLDEVKAAVSAGADALLLDNMNTEDLRQAAEIARGSAITEASGMITLDNVAEVAATGVDLISVGALTHSVKALDMGLDYEA